MNLGTKRKFKSVRTVSAQQMYRKWSDYAEGDVVIGQYVGIHVCDYEKENMKIKVVDAQFKDGTGENYIGKVLVLNSCGSLDKARKEVSLNEYIQMEYTGTTEITKGKFTGKDAHTISLEVVELDEEEQSDDGL